MKEKVETTVTIKWDKPGDENWLCPDNIATALHAYCKNTNFEVSYPNTEEVKTENYLYTEKDFTKVEMFKNCNHCGAFAKNIKDVQHYDSCKPLSDEEYEKLCNPGNDGEDEDD